MKTVVYFVDSEVIFEAMRAQGMKGTIKEISERFGIAKSLFYKYCREGLVYAGAVKKLQERLLHPLGLDIETATYKESRGAWSERPKDCTKMPERLYLNEKKVFEAMREKGFEMATACGIEKYFGVKYDNFRRYVREGIEEVGAVERLKERLLKPLGLDVGSAFITIDEKEPGLAARSKERKDCLMYRVNRTGRGYCDGLEQLYCARSEDCAFYKPKTGDKKRA